MSVVTKGLLLKWSEGNARDIVLTFSAHKTSSIATSDPLRRAGKNLGDSLSR